MNMPAKNVNNSNIALCFSVMRHFCKVNVDSLLYKVCTDRLTLIQKDESVILPLYKAFDAHTLIALRPDPHKEVV